MMENEIWTPLFMDRYTSADKHCDKPCEITHISSQFRSALGGENGRNAYVNLEFPQKVVCNFKKVHFHPLLSTLILKGRLHEYW